MADRPPARIMIAEQWRQAGEELRRRSPALFEKLLNFVAASVSNEDEEEVTDIIFAYRTS